MTKEDFEQLLENKPVFLDGATGSNLRKAGMPKDAVAELWILRHPKELSALQRQYVDAGSQIIYAPTFQATPLAMEKAGLSPRETEKLIQSLVSITREAVQGRALVAGDMTTMAASIDVWDHSNRAVILENYRRQIAGLLNAGVDLIGAETLLYPHEGELIWEAAALEGVTVPMVYTYTMDCYGCLFSGADSTPVLRELEEAGAAAVGFNCVAAGENLPALVSRLRRQIKCPLVSKPNAGDPRVLENGEVLYPMEKETFADLQKKAFEFGASILGGCCGTNPAFIRELRERVG